MTAETELGPSRPGPRIAVLWNSLTGYVRASLLALVDEGADVTVFHRQAYDDAPFDLGVVTRGLSAHPWSEAGDPIAEVPDAAAVGQMLEELQPDALLVCGWHFGGYLKLARRWHGRSLRLLHMDNQWWGTMKQWGGVLASPWMIRRNFDAVYLPDERSAVFAAKLGFPAECMMWGTYTCDYADFAAVADARGSALPPKAFLFAGRLAREKGIDVLVSAYAAYRRAVADPWPLLVAGTGPQEHLLRGQPGVELLGFVQPDDLPKVFEQAGCLVLPSRFEPWGVVVHEATTAGLPVVCTRVCGASTRLVLDGYNGVVVTPDDPGALTIGLRRVHDATDDERQAMGEASSSLARQYTPQRWAQNLLRRIPELRAQVGLTPAPWLG